MDPIEPYAPGALRRSGVSRYLLLGVVAEAGDDVGFVVGVGHQPKSRSLSTSGRRASLGADQAERLASSTEADWGGRSHGGPGHGVALPAAGGGWALDAGRRKAAARSREVAVGLEPAGQAGCIRGQLQQRFPILSELLS